MSYQRKNPDPQVTPEVMDVNLKTRAETNSTDIVRTVRRGRPKKQERKKILVRAVRLGYYGDQRRYPIGSGHPKAGQPFWVYEDEFSDSDKRLENLPGKPIGWMEKVIPGKKPKTPSQYDPVPWIKKSIDPHAAEFIGQESIESQESNEINEENQNKTDSVI